MEYIVHNIYNQETLSFLKTKGIHHFGFNFQTKSPWFTQQYVIFELIEKNAHSKSFFYLNFSGEKDFMISKILSDLEAKNYFGIKKEQFILIFDDKRDHDFFDQFGYQYHLYLDPMRNLEKIKTSELCTGLILDFNYLVELNQKHVLEHFCATMHKHFKDTHHQLIFNVDWDSDIFSSIFEYFQFNSTSTCINGHVESGFRQVDSSKLEEGMRFIQNLF